MNSAAPSFQDELGRNARPDMGEYGWVFNYERIAKDIIWFQAKDMLWFQTRSGASRVKVEGPCSRRTAIPDLRSL